MTGGRDAAVAALALGVVHAAVDAACAFVLFRDVDAPGAAAPAVFAWIVAYDVVAFALQAPLGLLADRLGAYRAFALTGLGCVVAALSGGALAPGAAAILAGLGNALFHVGAGAHVLRCSRGSAAEIGYFVGPGAVGLSLGILIGRSGTPSRAALAAAVGLASAVVVRCMPSDGAKHGVVARRSGALRARLGLVCGGLLLLTIALRSLVGDAVVAAWRAESAALLLTLAALAACGKMLGGLLGDRVGWARTAGAGLALAGPLLALGLRDPRLAAAGMLLLQVTTPLTVKAVHRLLPERPGLAFGVPSAALLLGAAPGLLHLWSLGPLLVLGATVLQAAAVVTGLRALPGAATKACSEGESLTSSGAALRGDRQFH